jgi:hypothetical protein
MQLAVPPWLFGSCSSFAPVGCRDAHVRLGAEILPTAVLAFLFGLPRVA